MLTDLQVIDQYADLVRKWADRFPRVVLGPTGGVHFSIYAGPGTPRTQKFTPLAECRRVIEELSEDRDDAPAARCCGSGRFSCFNG